MASYLSNALFFALDLLGPAPERWMKKTKIGVEECKRSKWQIKENRRVRKREKASYIKLSYEHSKREKNRAAHQQS